MNIQNIPGDGPVKSVFVPKHGMFSSFDYQAIEPRLFAYYVKAGLGDSTVADWFIQGRDVYKELAGQAFGKPADKITDKERTQGKVLFLMTLYSAGPRKIGESLNLSYADAKDLYTTFHKNLPQLRMLSNPKPRNDHVQWKPGLVERTLRNRGHLLTPWGRPLRPEQYGEHKMLNKLIQGSAAHLMKRAIIRLDEASLAPMVATIHDEVIFDHEPDRLELLHNEVPKLMTAEPVITEVVPLDTDHEVCYTSWHEKEPYDSRTPSAQAGGRV